MVEIVKHIENQKEGWTATTVLEAYLQRALDVQEHINFMTEREFLSITNVVSRPTPFSIALFESAFKDARALDEEFAATGRLRGPLHGVPISLKDMCASISQ